MISIDIEMILWWYIVINLLAYLLYWLDKRAAIHGHWRVAESTLLMSVFLGGGIGAYIAQQQFRHKIRKRSFQVLFWLTVMGNGIAILILLHPEWIKSII